MTIPAETAGDAVLIFDIRLHQPRIEFLILHFHIQLHQYPSTPLVPGPEDPPPPWFTNNRNQVLQDHQHHHQQK